LNISVRQVWRMLDANKLPRPIRLGRTIRWPKATVDHWISNAGDPGGKGR
jgi:excisionase family DNA binding protein